LNLKTAARRLGVHYQTAYRWVRSGQLVAVKVGAGYEISDAALARFQAQQVALQRVPEAGANPNVATAAPTREQALSALDEMLAGVSLDGSPVVERAVRLSADVLGDGAIVSLRDDDGDFEVAHVAHMNPLVEPTVAGIARDAPFTRKFAHMVVATGRTLHVPQVPQRDVRRCLRPELHEHLIDGSLFSLICVPIASRERVDGTFLVLRDRPGYPYTTEDVEFVEALARRVSIALRRSDSYRAAWAARGRTVEAVAALVHDFPSVGDAPRRAVDAALDDIVVDEPDTPVAVLDLELRHIACTKAYAEMFGCDLTDTIGRSLTELVADPVHVRSALQKLFIAELDFRTLEARPADAPGAVLHAAMVRRADASPWGVVIVGHALPS